MSSPTALAKQYRIRAGGFHVKSGCKTCKYLPPFLSVSSRVVTLVVGLGAKIITSTLSCTNIALRVKGTLYLIWISSTSVLSSGDSSSCPRENRKIVGGYLGIYNIE